MGYPGVARPWVALANSGYGVAGLGCLLFDVLNDFPENRSNKRRVRPLLGVSSISMGIFDQM
jgi:hypothetical protein